MIKRIVEVIAIATVLGVALMGCASKNESPQTESKTMNSEETQKATIVIDGGKYTPNVVNVERGKPVELTFQGGRELGCGGTVVFKSLNQSKEVASGKSVTFSFTPDQAGEIPFTCVMDMYDGKVVVK